MPDLKGVIIAAGYGSRFLPATKTVPKEMIPLLDIPCIDFIIKEFIEAGIEEIIVVSQRRKKALEDYFDREIELERFFEKENKPEFLKKIAMDPKIRVAFVRQPEMRGTGDAVMSAGSFVGKSPFIVAYPDDLVFAQKGLSLQMAENFKKYKKSILTTMTMDGDVSKYGVVKLGEKLDSRTYMATGIVEKPKPGEEPSKQISIGRYLFTPEIFDYLKERNKSHQKGEFFITEGILELISRGEAVSYSFDGTRLDTGTPAGFLDAVLEYSLTRAEFKQVLMDFIKRKGL